MMKHAPFLAAIFALMSQARALAAEPAPVVQAPAPASLPGPHRFGQQTGKELYDAVCASCHMPNGKGAVGAGYYPSLANDARFQAWSYPAMLVLKGNGAMPGFADRMTDAQIIAVVTYVRTHFGNAFADPISPEQLKLMRGP